MEEAVSLIFNNYTTVIELFWKPAQKAAKKKGKAWGFQVVSPEWKESGSYPGVCS